MDIGEPNWLVISSLISNLILPVAGEYPTPNQFENEQCYEIRAIYDIGSQGTKYMLAEVDTCRSNIRKVLVNNLISVDYSEDLSRSEDKTFSYDIHQKGLNALQTAKRRMESVTPNIDKHCAVATAAFRSAHNSEALVEDFSKKTEISVKVITQEDEGNLALLSVIHAYPKFHNQNFAVWDIGGGSMQLSHHVDSEQHRIHCCQWAMHSLLTNIFSEVLHRDPTGSVFPISKAQIEKGIEFTKNRIEFPEGLFSSSAASPQIVGVGGVHNKMVQPICAHYFPEHENYYTLSDLDYILAHMADKNEPEIQNILGGSDNTLKNYQLSSLILAYAFMEKYGVDTITTLPVGNVEGLAIRGC